jgi:hypothetical protein
MTVDYEYANKNTCPDLEGIHTDVAASTMDNKNIQGCHWTPCAGFVRKGKAKYKPAEDWTVHVCDSKCKALRVTWDVELSSGDEGKLDTIVDSNS